MGDEWKQPQGWSAYTTIGETRADLLASKLYEAAEANFPERRIRKDFSDWDADFEASFYIMRHTVMPAALTENFMMDNLDDVAFLLSEEAVRLSFLLISMEYATIFRSSCSRLVNIDIFLNKRFAFVLSVHYFCAVQKM